MKKRLLGVALGCVLALGMFMLSGCDNPFNKSTYTPTGKSPQITTPTIGVAGTLRVGVNTNNPPLAGQASKIVGIDVDIAAALADELGLKLEIVDVGTNASSSLQKGTVDIALGIDSTNSDTALWKSTPYIQTGVALFAASASTALPTEKSKIAAQSTSLSAWTAQEQFGSDALTNVSDLKAAFSELASGTVQYVASDAIIGSYAVRTAGNEAYIVGLMAEPSGYCAAALASNTALTQQISTALTKLSSTGIISVIENKWLGKTIDLSKTAITPESTKSDSEEEEEAE